MSVLPKIWISWSSGKDSAYALDELKRQNAFEITGLMTTVNEAFERVAMHAVRETLLLRQAEELKLPLHRIKIPNPCSNELYEKQMLEAIDLAKRQSVTHMMFGDLFLEDIRRYREKMLRPTGQLAKDMIAAGFKAIITCVDPKQLSPSFAGRKFDEQFLKDLPEGVDPCGENGEFHSFVYDGPIFHKPIDVNVGEIVERDGFIFADVHAK